MRPPNTDFVIYLVIDNKQVAVKDLELRVRLNGTMYLTLNINDSWAFEQEDENEHSWGNTRMTEDYIRNLCMTPYPEANIIVSHRASNWHGKMRVLVIDKNVNEASSTALATYNTNYTVRRSARTNVHECKIKVYCYDRIGRVRNFCTEDYDLIANEIMFLYQEETEKADRFIDGLEVENNDGVDEEHVRLA